MSDDVQVVSAAYLQKLLSDRDRLEAENYALKLAAAGDEDVPGSAMMVTPEDVARWRKEAIADREHLAEQVRVAREALRSAATRLEQSAKAHNCSGCDDDAEDIRAVIRQLGAARPKDSAQ